MVNQQTATEQRAMIIVPGKVLEKIDRNRDQMGRAEFIEFCMDALLKGGEGTASLTESGMRHYEVEGTVSRQEFDEFKKGIKSLQRAYIDLLLSATLEPTKKTSAEEQEHFKQRVAEILKV